MGSIFSRSAPSSEAGGGRTCVGRGSSFLRVPVRASKSCALAAGASAEYGTESLASGSLDAGRGGAGAPCRGSRSDCH